MQTIKMAMFEQCGLTETIDSRFAIDSRKKMILGVRGEPRRCHGLTTAGGGRTM